MELWFLDNPSGFFNGRYSGHAVSPRLVKFKLTYQQNCNHVLLASDGYIC